MKFKSERYPQLQVKVPGGKVVRFTDGEADVTDPDAVEALKKMPDAYEVYEVKAAGEAPAQDGPPSKRASKEEWVDYAVDAHGVEREEAEAMTKTDLVDLYGGE